MNIERKIHLVDIKQGVKGITNDLLYKLISNPGQPYFTRKCMWYSVKHPGFEIYDIIRVKGDKLFEHYATYIDERGIIEEIIVYCDEIKL